MTTKKEIYAKLSQMEKTQVLNHNLQAALLPKILAELMELRSIKDILEDAAKEPEPVKEDKTLADIFEDMNKTMKESTLFEDVPKKERKTRRLRPSPEMRQLGSWAKHYHRSIREFSWAMRKMEMPIRESEGERRNLQYAWLTPGEAKTIDKYLTEMNR